MGKLDISHYIGCLVGGAVGDALGAPIEFLVFLNKSKIWRKWNIRLCRICEQYRRIY